MSFSLINLFKVIVEGILGFLTYIIVKVFIAPNIIAASLVFPQYTYK